MARIAGHMAGGDPAAMLERIGASNARAVGAGRGGMASTGRGGVFGDVSVVLDGYIYNPEDLPDGEDDAERLALAFRKWGFEETLRKINGDFALALHHDDVTYLGRDRFGVKPLYFTPRPFAFASRPRALFGVVPAAPRRHWAAVFAVSNYRFFDNQPHLSPYEGIEQVPAGCWVRAQGDRIETRRYYRPEDRPSSMTLDELAERYRALLRDAVDRRLRVADAPAFTLSGGMDSSSVATMAHDILGRPVSAVSTVYSEDTALSEYDESEEIQDVIDAGIARWTPVPIEKPDLFTQVRRLVALHDEPVATVTWMTHHALCERVARDGHRSLFGGLGGDEQHAGEYDYFFYFFADLLKAGRVSVRDQEIAAWAHHHDHPIHRKDVEVANLQSKLRTDDTPGRNRPNLQALVRYRDALDPAYFDLTEVSPILDAPFSSHLETHAYNELMRSTMPCCLRASDRNTSAFDLDDFFPFFDHRLYDLAVTIPGEMKIRDGVTKTLLRRAMTGALPDATRTRIKKTGWNAPAHVWFATTERDNLFDLIRSRDFQSRGIYDAARLEALAHEHFDIVSTGRPEDNHMMLLWQVINLDAWFRDAFEG